MANDSRTDRMMEDDRPVLTIGRAGDAEGMPKPVRISNPEGVRKSVGAFRDDPRLGELMNAIREAREREKNVEIAA